MSWSTNRANVPQADARQVGRAMHEEQGAYSYDGAHKRVMDEAADFIARMGEGAPEGTELGISSYGHFNQDGTGNVTVSITVGKLVPQA